MDDGRDRVGAGGAADRDDHRGEGRRGGRGQRGQVRIGPGRVITGGQDLGQAERVGPDEYPPVGGPTVGDTGGAGAGGGGPVEGGQGVGGIGWGGQVLAGQGAQGQRLDRGDSLPGGVGDGDGDGVRPGAA